MGGRAAPSELEPLLAAILEAEHTLVLGSDWTDADLEPLFVLLPPRLRSELTVRTNARAVPPAPLPRLLITPLTDEQPFQREAGLWTHRLPATQSELSAHARELAANLLALLAMPERLAEAHEAYEQYIERYAVPADTGPADTEPTSLPPAALARSQPRRSLAAEVETVLRFARMAAARSDGEPKSALRVLGQAAAGRDDAEAQTELAYLVDLLRNGFTPASIGEAVADLVRDPQMPPSVLAFVMKRMLAERSDETRLDPQASASPSTVRPERPTSHPKNSGGTDERVSPPVDGGSGVRGARYSRSGVRALRTAAALVVVGAIVAGAIVARRGAGGVMPVEARATTPVARASTDTAEAAAPAKPTFKEVLADAKAWAAAEEWDLVIGMLSENEPAWTEREALPWNTLLAQAALLQAQRLPAIDARRNTLFVTAHDRATLALVSIKPFAEEADVLRLLRAEACIIGDLGCESTKLTEDILLAARSPYVAVSNRAIELLGSLKP